MSEQAAEHAGTTGDLVVRAVLRSDVGLVRSDNQDFATLTGITEESASLPGGRLFVVADGMGGHRGGATASRLAVETLKAQYLGAETSDIPTALGEALTRANARVFSEAQANADLRGMGTTTSALAIRDDRAWFAHVGDSRIYLIRGDGIRQLTDDHSLVASMVREGLLTREEAENHPRRNVLQRSVGVGERVEIDVRGPIKVKPGDTFVICSDGLHGLVKEPELKEIAKLGIEEAADLFVQRALERGAPDNVTVIVARIELSEGADPSRYSGSEEDEETGTLDSAPFDETARETATDKLAALPPQAEATEHEVGEAVTEGAPAPKQEPPAAAGGAPATRGVPLIWMFLVVVILGLAGWWWLIELGSR